MCRSFRRACGLEGGRTISENPPTAAKNSGFRPDIQGLRALAVSLVVIYHLWPERVTGGYVGVDVFFVISGFLITSHLIRKPPLTGREMAQFYGRRIRRLLPASFAVLAATAVATRLVSAPTQWEGIAKEIIASALYVQNWVLAGSSVDYLAEGNDPTPTQHFWSLAVEEQFYLVWPLVIMAAFWIAAKRRLRAGVLVRYAIAAVVVISLVVSVLATATEPGAAYFITPTRMWELAIGGLVGSVAPLTVSRLNPSANAVLAWVGILAIVVAGVTYTEATPFPGSAALLPVLGTALAILAGSNSSSSPTRIFRWTPVQWLGGISYSVYLWHWPLIVLVPYVSGGELGWLDKAVILVATIVLAALSKTFIEDKFRFTKSAQGLLPTFRFAAAGMILMTVLGAAQLAEVNYRSQQAEQRLSAIETSGGPCLGAAAIAKGFDVCEPDPTAELVPEPELAKDDRSDAYADGCWSNEPFTERPICTYANGEKKVALVGNSHAGHWLPPLQKLAERNDWTISTFLVSRCNPTDAPLELDTQKKTDNCLAYGDWVMEQTKGDKFDLVITSERQSVPVQGESWETTEAPALAGYKSYLSRWAEAGTNVVVIKDPLFPGGSIPDCLAENPGNPGACAGTPEDWYWMDPLTDAAKELSLPNIETISMDEYFCKDGVCHAAIGSVVTFFDGSHITATYAKTLAPYLDQSLQRVLRN
ncbi:acyltransferase [Arthrobacter sp. SF27]|nr:acyltransferase [Arthrobacter sp. SF27]